MIHSTTVWLPQTMTWLDTQVRFLPPERVESDVVCERTENLDQFPVARLHSHAARPRLRALAERGARKLRLRRDLGQLARVARDRGAHVLHSHFGNRAWADLPAARAAGLRHAVTFYGYDVNHLPRADRRWAVRYRELFDAVDLVLCEGPHMASSIVALGCRADKVQVQRLGVELARIPCRARAWRPGEPLRVLLAATFREKKGLVYAVEALGRLRGELPLEVTVVGDATSEPRSLREKEAIRAAAARSGLDRSVRWLGFLPYRSVMDEAYAHHVFLSPSVTAADGDTEGGAPVSLIDMAASGMPIVSSVHCDIPEVVEHGVGGMLAPERDVDALVECLRAVVAMHERWPALARAARERVESRFDAVRQAEELAGRYERLVAGRADGG